MQLDGQVDWNWWVVFLPTWVVLFGQLAGCCTVFMLASKLASGTLVEGKEDDELIKAVTSCCGWSVTFVTAILAVAAIAGGHYSTYVVFIPQFVIAGLLVCCMTCIICCIRDLPEDDLGGRQFWLILSLPSLGMLGGCPRPNLSLELPTYY
ncbi:unnamed protein product [Ascophyllum nodosum]